MSSSANSNGSSPNAVSPDRPVFALVDCNNFYASCEKLFAPRLKTRPVVVLSNNDYMQVN